MPFEDRADAGRRLAAVDALQALEAPMVLAIPRGGVPVGFEVARALDAPLDVFVVRKVGAPHQPEFGIGAVAEGGALIVDEQARSALRISDRAFTKLVERERKRVRLRLAAYRGDRALPDLRGRAVVLVDDGLATGVTAEAALADLRTAGAGHLVLAVPVAAPEAKARLSTVADQVVSLECPTDFMAVGQWYERFGQTSDDEVVGLLERAAQP